MTITTSSLVCAGAEAVDFVSDRIQAGLAKNAAPRFKTSASRPRRARAIGKFLS